MIRATYEKLEATWPEMLRAIGEDPAKHRRSRRKWTRETVMEWIGAELPRNPDLQARDLPAGLYLFIRQELRVGWSELRSRLLVTCG